MKHWVGEITGAFKTTLKHAFEERDTVCYPAEKPDLPERWRGRLILTVTPEGEERCVACYLCSSVCPSNAITIQGAEREDDERRYAEKFEIDFTRCIFCGMCEEACPTRAIQTTNDFEMGASSRAELVYDKSRLLENHTGKYPEFDYFKNAGVPIRGKDVGEGANEKPPVDVYTLLP
ncbi:NADH-quinone oxidoreductase subunit NuoI [Pokkaliibacter sp. CJK22405]|uniref:NADH-quinone oxidoreductase subunit NuoI n=1 Tax=Pokkaliibacter sp. CJK22405 TaxID=3384615 RepID=UPI0039848679